MPTLFLAVT